MRIHIPRSSWREHWIVCGKQAMIRKLIAHSHHVFERFTYLDLLVRTQIWIKLASSSFHCHGQRECLLVETGTWICASGCRMCFIPPLIVGLQCICTTTRQVVYIICSATREFEREDVWRILWGRFIVYVSVMCLIPQVVVGLQFSHTPTPTVRRQTYDLAVNQLHLFWHQFEPGAPEGFYSYQMNFLGLQNSDLFTFAQGTLIVVCIRTFDCLAHTHAVIFCRPGCVLYQSLSTCTPFAS